MAHKDDSALPKAGDTVKHSDGRAGVVVRRIRAHRCWIVRLPDGTVTHWWKSDLAAG